MNFSVFGKQIAITVPRQALPEITFSKQGAVLTTQPKPLIQLTPRTVASAAESALCSLNSALLRLQSTNEIERTIVLMKDRDDLDVVTSSSQNDSRDDRVESSTVLWTSGNGHKSTRKKKTEPAKTTT